MRQTPPIGKNLTGRQAAPDRFDEMLEANKLRSPTSEGGAHDLGKVRAEYAREGDGVGTGSIPKVGARMSEEMAMLVDKLGERLVFESAGTRLYDALLSKHDAYGSFDGGPSRDDLEEIRAQEHAHFLMLAEVIEKMGGDPTAVTPAANVTATASAGIGKVLQDPRTTLLQSLDAILVAELADHDGWEALIELVRLNGHDDVAERFEIALDEEEEHLAKVRRWLAHGQGRTRQVTH
jgi:rubrerythrin